MDAGDWIGKALRNEEMVSKLQFELLKTILLFAALVMFGYAWLGDKYHLRGPIILFNMVLCLVGLPIMGFHANSNVRYFGVFLTTAGANSNIPATMSYQANNIRGQWKRAFCSAILVGMGGVGGIAGGLVFRYISSVHILSRLTS